MYFFLIMSTEELEEKIYTLTRRVIRKNEGERRRDICEREWN